MYAIYANPEHIHFLVSRNPDMSENELAVRKIRDKRGSFDVTAGLLRELVIIRVRLFPIYLGRID